MPEGPTPIRGVAGGNQRMSGRAVVAVVPRGELRVHEVGHNSSVRGGEAVSRPSVDAVLPTVQQLLADIRQEMSRYE
jgi:hypothetical protein